MNPKIKKLSLQSLTHLSLAILVIIWIIPTAGLLVSSFRDKNQISASGWWTAFNASKQNLIVRANLPQTAVEENGVYIMTGNVFTDKSGQKQGGEVLKFGISSKAPNHFSAGETAVRQRTNITVFQDGKYRITSTSRPKGKRGQRLFITAIIPPSFNLENYREVLFAEGMLQGLLNTATVTIPATIIPILIAAFAAYALAWMKFPGRALLLTTIVGLLVVPLQMSLIPLLKLHNVLGLGKTYLGVWLAHTGFGLPLAIYLLRNYMIGLPKEIIESSRMDGANDFQIFQRIILPLSFPALASFAIFQFLWVWNDLLVATVFLGNSRDKLVMTGHLRELLGYRSDNWEILTASAFISIIIPLLVFFALQKYLVRGLLAGSVK